MGLWQGHEMLDEPPGPPVPITVLGEEAKMQQPSTDKLRRIIGTSTTTQPGQLPPPRKPVRPGGERRCSRCEQPGHRSDSAICTGKPPDVRVAERVAPTVASSKPGATLQTAAFHSAGRGQLWLSLVPAKRVPFTVRVRHKGCGKAAKGVVATATTETEGLDAFNLACDKAKSRGWRPGPLPQTAQKLVEIPLAPKRPYVRQAPKKGARKR